MTTTCAGFEKANHSMAIIVGLVICSVAASAQPSLPAGTPIRITLASKEFMEGSLVSSDTGSITVRVNANDIAVPRRQIATMSAMTSTRALRYGGRLGIATSAVGAFMFYGLVNGICESESCRDGAPMAALAGAGAGFLTGGVVGAIAGSFFRDWEPLPEFGDVGGRARGPSAAETCPSNPAVAIQGGYGWARGGGTTRPGAQPGSQERSSRAVRIGVTLLCRTSFSVGAEGGSLGGETLGSFSQTVEGTTRTYLSTVIDRSSAFKGGFVEIPLHGPLNPHLIASAGSYSRIETTSTSTGTQDDTSSEYAFASSTAVDASRHPGGSLGVGLSMPLFAHASLGADARIHLVAGQSSIRTMGFTLNVRR